MGLKKRRGARSGIIGRLLAGLLVDRKGEKLSHKPAVILYYTREDSAKRVQALPGAKQQGLSERSVKQ